MSAKQYAVPMPIQFDRLFGGPLEKYDTFESYAEALTYAQSPISYPGQRIGVKKSELKEELYTQIVNLMVKRNFKELIENLEISEYSDKSESEENFLHDLYKFYTKEQEEKYGVVGIQIKIRKE